MIKCALDTYVATVEKVFTASRHQARSKGGLIELRNKAQQLHGLVEQLEDGREFQTLVDETRSKFRNDWPSSKSESSWKYAIRHFFRRTGYYTRAFSDTPSTLFQAYEEAFLRRQVRTTYLAPMEFVYFSRPEFRFSDFQIRQLDRDELETIVGNEVNRVFYPYAIVDTRALQRYWFLIVTIEQPAPRLRRSKFEWSSIDRVPLEYTRFPSAIERVLARLVLFDWVVEPQDDHSPYRSQFGFNIPFVVRVDDDYLSSPKGAPDCSKLATTPQIDPLTEEEYEAPTVFFDLNEPHAVTFEECTSRADDCLRQLEADPARWPFLKVALGNLIKAFFTDGLEQLLWHITALEALLGERKPGLTESLAKRGAVILGATENERRQLRKRLKELYALRCDLVHGNEFEDEVQWQQLFEARTFARQITIWFLHYLGQVATRINERSWQGEVPKREDFLSLLDLSDTDRARLSSLLSNLPSGFPTAPEWPR